MGLIQVENLVKQYRQAVKKPGVLGAIEYLIKGEYTTKTAVNNISFTIEEGESVAYLGKNGAGKSTTIKMLTGVLKSSSGTILIDNQDPFKNRLNYTKNIGAVFGQRTQLWWDLPVRDSFGLLKEIFMVDQKTYKQNLDCFCELLGMNEFLHLTARSLSLGQRMRADIAAALLHDPKILFLDEPTLGLDVIAKEKIRNFIKFTNREKKTTVILTTHDLEDIEHICERLILIDRGSILFDGNLQLMIDRFTQTKKIHCKIKASTNKLSASISRLNDLNIEKLNDSEIVIAFNRFCWTAGDIVAELMKVAKVQDIKIEEPNIEMILKMIYEGELPLEAHTKIGAQSS